MVARAAAVGVIRRGRRDGEAKGLVCGALWLESYRERYDERTGDHDGLQRMCHFSEHMPGLICHTLSED